MTRARGERGETEPTGLGGTPRRREERAGDSERTRLLAYFRQAPAAIAVTAGPEHVFEFINPAYLAAMGRDAGDAGELVGRPLRELFPALARQGVFEALDRAYATGEPFKDLALSLRLAHDGAPEDVVLDVTYQPLRDDAGRVHGLLLLEVDVTALVRSRAQVAAERVLRQAQDDILNLATHDLRTPLTTMRGRASLVRSRLVRGDPLDPVWLDAQLAAIDAAVDRMLGTIGAVDDAARLRVGEALDLERDPVDVAALAQAVVAEVAPQRAVVVQVPEAPVTVLGDRTRLGRALQNLVGNAIKYSAEATPVRVTVTTHARMAVVAVRDRGVGIPADELPRVTERSYRASTARGVAGSGLGLYGAKAIVAQHGGTIAVESAVATARPSPSRCPSRPSCGRARRARDRGSVKSQHQPFLGPP